MKEPVKGEDTDTGKVNAADPASANATSTTPSNKSPRSSEVVSGTFDTRRFGSDVLVYAIGNGLVLVFGFIPVLIIPKYLSVEGYGYWQLFILYASYVGISHLGFVDGVLVRWAGKEFSQVGGEIKTALRFLLLEQGIVIIPLGVLLYFILHPPFQWIGLMILAYTFITNLVTFFTFTTQAVRRFKLLTAVNVGISSIFLLFVLLLFSLGYLDYHHVIFASLTASLLTLFALAFWFRKYLWGKSSSGHGELEAKQSPLINTSGAKRRLSSLWAYGKENINIGIFVLLGNFVFILFMTIDRLMVSSFFPIEQFAIYAFALMVAGVTYTFVRAISQVFFPHLSAMTGELRTRTYQLGKPAIIIAWAGILTIYFPAAGLIEFYLPRYVDSLPMTQIILCTVGFGGLIQILHVNYYMAYRKQSQYFLWGVTSLALSALLNFLAIMVWDTLISVATATLISFGIWYIVNELTLRLVVAESNRQLWRGLLIICCYIAAFWLASFLADWFIARMLIYVGIFCVLTWLLLRNEVKELIIVANGLRNRHE